ncbi:hypothetical protein [Xanthobacter aminoxidans]|uniref:DarT domain-containing protein n=1 Tax=Xanthobacter aminoxidans TaxID=186280 RepID=A0ABW6Z9V9_9HYPH
MAINTAISPAAPASTSPAARGVPIYHFTSTAHLPWIIESGELRAGRNKIGGFPDPDFLWATSNRYGDRTATAMASPAYRDGKTWAVRLTLDPVGFAHWSIIPGLFAQWTGDQVERLERLAAGKSDPRDWWCAPGPMPLSCVTVMETRSYRDSSWKRIEPEVTTIWQGGTKWLGVQIGDRQFFSAKCIGPHGQDAYEMGRVL